VNLRTTAAAVAGAVIGIVGALAFLTPANATTPLPGAGATLSLRSSCDGGGWQVTYKLRTFGTLGADGTFTKSTFSLDGSAYGGGDLPIPPPIGPRLFGQGGKITGDGELTDEMFISHYFGGLHAKLSVTWHLGGFDYTKDLSADAQAPKPSDCGWAPPPSPIATPTPSAGDYFPPPTDSPSPSGSDTPAAVAGTDAGTGGGLPITGAAGGTIAGVAAGLLAAGVVLFVGSRRRRVKFTA
jgi:LPXTG-motif cell wall-anchored protein